MLRTGGISASVRPWLGEQSSLTCLRILSVKRALRLMERVTHSTSACIMYAFETDKKGLEDAELPYSATLQSIHFFFFFPSSDFSVTTS